jgi:hypothetical protein
VVCNAAATISDNAKVASGQPMPACLTPCRTDVMPLAEVQAMNIAGALIPGLAVALATT